LELVTGNNNFTLIASYSSYNYNVFWSIWIDFNQDAIYSADEQVHSGSSTAAINALAVIPQGKIGSARMRVVMRYGSAATTPCGTFSYGEVEDYSVNISQGTAPDQSPDPSPINYCNSQGNNTSYKWSKSVKVNNYTYTNANVVSGYFDHT